MLLSSELQSTAVEALRARLHNQTPDEFKTEIEALVESAWSDHVDRWLPSYRAGHQILDHGLAEALFEVTSLGTWLLIAERAGLQVVPAWLVDTFDVAAAIGAGKVPGSEDGRDAVRRGLLIRPDAGCAVGAKAARSAGYPLPASGGAAADGSVEIDERLSHLFLQYLTVNGRMPLWARPVVPDTALRTASSGAPWGRRTWPVEYRVFVHGSAFAGVSAYYLQAPARDRGLVRDEARACVDAAKRVLEVLSALKVKPWHPRYSEHPAVGPGGGAWFSCDFMIARDGTPLFLEAGPGHLHGPNWGAHPCCFEPTKVRGLAYARGDVDPGWT